MKANYKIEAGDVSVIRPLCYAREALMKDFARTNRLPLVNENCPACFEEPKERHRVKKVIFVLPAGRVCDSSAVVSVSFGEAACVPARKFSQQRPCMER